MNNETLKLNFLALEEQDFSFPVHCCRVDDSSTSKKDDPNVYRYSLGEANDEYNLYDLTLGEYNPNKWERRDVHCSENNRLTERYLLDCLIEKCNEHDIQYIDQDKVINKKEIKVVTNKDKDGREYLAVRPAYISSLNKFGYLLNHGFDCNEGVNRYADSILKKTFFHNKQGKYNIELQMDVHDTIVRSIQNKKIFSLNIDNDPLEKISFYKFGLKKIITGKNHVHTLPFTGIKNSGPYCAVKDEHKIYFLYEKNDKTWAHQLYFALVGEYNEFSGLDKFFMLKMEKGKNYDGIQIADLNESLNNAATKIQSENIANKIAILVLNKQEDSVYYKIKKIFLEKKIPIQLVLIDNIKNKNKLRWIVSSIALQCFAKIGGIPWRVQSKNSNKLIIGVGQSINKNSSGEMSKYYGYSVMTDASGVYKETRFLYSDADEQKYLHGLLDEIKKIIEEKKNEYNEFILHLTFKVKKYEIKKYLSNKLAAIKIIVIGINDKSDIKLFANSNSKIYHQGSYVKISNTRYMLCTEGIEKNLNKVTAWPLDINFIYPPRINENSVTSCIEDIYNLSGANWRGFNSSKLPVSLRYARLISIFMKGMQSIGELEVIKKIDSSEPWFL